MPSQDPDEQEDRRQADEEPIPKLPRASLLGKLSLPAIVRVGMFATLLYAIIAMRKPCSEGVSRFVTSFEDSPADAGTSPPTEAPGSYAGYELMTVEEALKRFPDAPDGGGDGGTGDAGPRDAGPEGAGNAP